VSDPVTMIRAIVQDELRALRLGDIGVVTSAFPHTTADDVNNYECSVKLRDANLELRKVPIATPHVGLASAPAAGELVLILYVGGDPNRPVIAGRFYSDEVRPPLHEAGEWRVESPPAGKTSIAIDKDQSVVATAGKTQITLKQDGSIEIKGEADLAIEVKGNVQLKCAECTIDASGNINLGKDGAGVITEKSHKCYITGKALVPSQSVRAKG